MTTISETRAYQLYYNYYVNGNSLNTPPEMMGRIVSEYSNKVKEWQAEISKDTNIYYFPEDDFEEWIEYGKDYAANETGYGNSAGDKAGQVANNLGNQASAGVGIYTGTTSGAFAQLWNGAGSAIKSVWSAVKSAWNNSSIGKFFKGLFGSKDAASVTTPTPAPNGTTPTPSGGDAPKIEFQKPSDVVKTDQSYHAQQAGQVEQAPAADAPGSEVGAEAGAEAGSESGKASAKDISAMVGCAAALATWILYMITRPNKEQYKALMEMQELLMNSQGDLAEQQRIMEEAAERTTALAEEAEAKNEDANNVMSESEAKYKMLMLLFMTLQSKIDSGKQLTPEEAEMYQILQEMMATESETIKETSEDTQSEVGELYDQMGESQGDFDTSAERIATVQGEHDYSKSFDRLTQILCLVTGATQGLNVVSGIANAVRVMSIANTPFTAWMYVFVAMGFTGATGSLIASIEQFVWAAKIGQEIQTRKATQDVINGTQGVYDNELNNFFMGMETVEGLELEVPEGTDAPTDGSAPQGNPNPGDNNGDDDNNRNKK